MAAYRYKAARHDGRVVTGVMHSPGRAELNATLFERGLFPLEIAPSGEMPLNRPAPRRELAIVFRSMASLVGAGVPLEKAVAATRQVAQGKLGALLESTRGLLHEGKSLGQALEGGHGLVPPLAIGMVRAGERGSRLARALEEVATHLEQEAELAAKVRQALAYPVLLAAVGTATVLLISTVVVPRFAELLADAGQDLPPATTALIGISTFLSRFGILLAAMLAAAFIAGREALKRPPVCHALHQALLSLPALGPLRHSLASARSARALGGMLEAGMPFLAALDASKEAAGDRAVIERIGRVRELVAQGAPFAQSLERERALTPVTHQLIAVGESSGQLAAMAVKAGDLAARESERRLRALVGMIEPALIVLFGGLVAFTAAALLQAVYAMRAV